MPSDKFYPVSRPSITELEERYVLDAVRSGWISSLGEYVNRFESGFAAFCGVEDAVTVANGTCALHLVLCTYGIRPGDEVIVPDLSFIATANAVVMAGAKPVFCDIQPDTLCLDPAKIAAAITPRTRAIMPVHLYGHPADMAAINAVAREHGLLVIEDAAEAHGAAIDGERVGGLGDCAVFSFYGNKNLTTGEGGMITARDPAFLARVRHLRDHAMSPVKRYWHDELGYNYRMTNLQAALGCAQLERADELLGGRREVFAHYERCLKGTPGVQLNRTAPGAVNSYWMVCMEIEGIDEARRSDIMAELKNRGVDSRPYFYPMSDMPYYPDADTPMAHRISARGLNLPTYLGLTREDVSYICTQIQHVLERWRLNA